MTKSIFITATNTNIGKTYATILLAKELHKRGLNVGLFKPIETGVDKIPLDGQKLFELSKSVNKNFNLSLEDIVPIQLKLPAAPYVANLHEDKIDFKKIKNAYEKIKNISDIVLVEGAGGVLVPVTKNFFMIDFVRLLEIDKTLLITHNSLGCINDTLLNIEFLKSKDINFLWCINQYPEKIENFKKLTLPFYKRYFNFIYQLQNTNDINSLIKQLIL